MKREQNRALEFAVCINNQDQEANLEVGKLYQIVPDPDATQHGYVRVIDESGEDYWHAADSFYQVAVPNDLALTLHAAYQTA
jgi:hypothetical protein